MCDVNVCDDVCDDRKQGGACAGEGYEVDFQMNQDSITYICVFGRVFQALIDTGANLSYISPRVSKWLLQNNSPVSDFGANLQIQTAAPKTTTIRNPKVFSFQFSNRQGSFSAPLTAFVHPSLSPDIVIGMSSLNQLNAQIRFTLGNTSSPLRLSNPAPLLIKPFFQRFNFEPAEMPPFAGRVTFTSGISGVEVKQVHTTLNPYARRCTVELRSTSNQDIWIKPEKGLLSAKYTELKYPVLTFRAHKNSQGVFVACPKCPSVLDSSSEKLQVCKKPFMAVFKIMSAIPKAGVIAPNRPLANSGGGKKAAGDGDTGSSRGRYFNRFSPLAVDHYREDEENSSTDRSCDTSPPGPGLRRNKRYQGQGRKPRTHIAKRLARNGNEDSAKAFKEVGLQTEENQVASVAVQVAPNIESEKGLGLSQKDIELQLQHKDYMTKMDKESFFKMFNMENSEVTEGQLAELQDVLYKNRVAFRPPNNSLPLPPASIKPIVLPLKANVPMYRKPRPNKWPLSRVSEASEQIQELVSQGVLEETDSNFVSDILLVPKPNGSVRMVCDLRACNEYLQTMVSTTHNIKSLIQAMGDGPEAIQYFSSIDMSSAFLQLPLSPISSPVLTIQCPKTFKRYCYRRLCFGSSLSPFFFQNAMMDIFGDLLNKDLFMYFDDVTMKSSSFDSHLALLDATLSRMAEYSLSINPNKSHFFKKSTEFLAHNLTPQGYSPAQAKITWAKNIPTPQSAKELSSALGFFTYFRSSIKDYAHLSAELFEVAKQRENFEWSVRHDRLFKCVKENFMDGPILSYPNYNKPFYIEVDTSGMATGSMLYQLEDKGGKEVPQIIAFAGNKLLERQRKYSVTQLELLGVSNALLAHQAHLFGQELIVYTDHQALITLLKQPQHVNNRVARFVATVASFNPKVIYKPGRYLKVADFLSRLDTWPENEIETLIQRRLFPQEELPVPSAEKEVFTFFNKLQADPKLVDPNPFTANELLVAQMQDPYCAAFIEFLNDDKLEGLSRALEKEVLLTASTYLIGPDKLLYKIDTRANPPRQQLVIPQRLVHTVLEHEHDNKSHGGIKATIASLKLRFHWKTLAKDVQNKIKYCQVCQNFKVIPRFRSSKTTHWPLCGVGDNLIVDIIGPLAPSNSFTHVLICMDEASRFVSLKPMKDLTITSIADALVDYFWSKGFVKSIRADNALYFQGMLMSRIYRLLRIENVRVATYSGFTQGAIERAVQTVKAKLRTSLEGKKGKWPMFLGPVAYAINTSPNNSFGLSSGITPAMLFFGRHLLSPLDVALPVADVELPANCVEKYGEVVQQVVQAQTEARTTLLLNMEKQTRGTGYEYHEGQLVQVLVDKLKTKDGGLMAKFARRYCGPFLVVKVISASVLQLANPENRETLKNLVNTRYCKPYYHRLYPHDDEMPAINPDDPPPTLSSEYLPREARLDIERQGTLNVDVVNKGISQLKNWQPRIRGIESALKPHWPMQEEKPRSPGWFPMPQVAVTRQSAPAPARNVSQITFNVDPDPGVNSLPMPEPEACVEARSAPQGPHPYATRSKQDPTVNKDYSRFFKFMGNLNPFKKSNHSSSQ